MTTYIPAECLAHMRQPEERSKPEETAIEPEETIKEMIETEETIEEMIEPEEMIKEMIEPEEMIMKTIEPGR